MIKKIMLSALCVSLMLNFTGCWNNRDLSEIAISSALGIDRTDDGKALVSVQILKPSSAKAGGKETGGGDGKGFVVVSNTADSVFGALRGMLSKVDNKIFYSSSQVIIIGENAAKAGIKDYLDFTLRDHETQFKLLVAVSKGVTAKEILEQEYDLSKVPGAYVRDTLDNSESRGFSKKMMLIEVARDLVNEGKELCIGTIKKEGKTTETEGMAVFQKDKLVGWLDSFETRGYMFITGRVQSTIIEVEGLGDLNKQVAIEIQKSSSKVTLEWADDGKPIYTVKIQAQGNIGEQHVQTKKEPEFIKSVTESCTQKIRKEAKLTIKKCQEEYMSDIFGFGALLFDKNPSYWKSVSNQWNQEVFPKIETRIEVDLKIVRSGLVNKPIEVR